MRIGRDGDIEEWLATDTSLERPVLIRSLGPETGRERREQFVASVSAAAKAAHSHLSRVFAVEEVEGGAYAVCEWTGGATVQDRISAGTAFELEEFLPNASGLAGALSQLHAGGAIHGAIDPSAVSYALSHPAKLGSFGRIPITDRKGDVRALAATLESALTGSAAGGPPPSESIDGVPRAVDRVLRSGQSGALTADDLEKAFLAAPTLRPSRPEPLSTSRRVLLVAGILVVLAVALVALGALFTGGGTIIAVPPTATAPFQPSTTTTTVASTVPSGPVDIVGITSFDPYGEGGENDEQLSNIIDGSNSTTWRTERYQDPLSLQKPGVGIDFEVTGRPSRIQLVDLTVGTEFGIYWSQLGAVDLDGWEHVLDDVASPGVGLYTLPPRSDGFWLLWLTELPLQPDGSYYAELAQVRFTP
jgi:serine/threonine protein kinase